MVMVTHLICTIRTHVLLYYIFIYILFAKKLMYRCVHVCTRIPRDGIDNNIRWVAEDTECAYVLEVL